MKTTRPLTAKSPTLHAICQEKFGMKPEEIKPLKHADSKIIPPLGLSGQQLNGRSSSFPHFRGSLKIRAWESPAAETKRRKTTTSPTPQTRRFKPSQHERLRTRTENRRLVDSTKEHRSIAEINDSLGGYPCGYACQIVLADARIIIERNEEVTWSKKRNRHWPESTSTSHQQN